MSLTVAPASGPTAFSVTRPLTRPRNGIVWNCHFTSAGRAIPFSSLADVVILAANGLPYGSCAVGVNTSVLPLIAAAPATAPPPTSVSENAPVVVVAFIGLLNSASTCVEQETFVVPAAGTVWTTFGAALAFALPGFTKTEMFTSAPQLPSESIAW